jgi:hypothetical protein
MFYHWKSFIAVALGAMLAMSCGKNGGVKVTKINLEERIDQSTEHVWIDVRTELSMGNTTLPSLKLPVNLPGKGLVGGLELGPNFVFVSVDLTQVIKLRASAAALPNGDRLPLIDTSHVVMLEAGANKKLKIYISLTAGSKAVGVAIPIAQLDQFGQDRGSAGNFMIPFNIQGTKIHAGTYWSPDRGENGLGIFVDLGTIFSRLMIQGQWVENHEDGSGYNLNNEVDEVDSETYQELQSFLGKQHKKKRKFSVLH